MEKPVKCVLLGVYYSTAIAALRELPASGRPKEAFGAGKTTQTDQAAAPIKEVSFLGGLLHGYRRERCTA